MCRLDLYTSLSAETTSKIQAALPSWKLRPSDEPVDMDTSFTYRYSAATGPTTVEAGNGFATCVGLELVRRVEINGDDGGRYFTDAIVWEKGSILSGSSQTVASRIRDQISQYLTALAAP